MKYYKLILFLFFVQFGKSQEISGIVLDSLSNETIPFAAITSSFGTITITNEEGKFRIFNDVPFSNMDTLFVSSMGYESKSFVIGNLKSLTINLISKVIELESVEVSNRVILTAAEIIKKVSNNLVNTYDFGYSSKKVFWRETSMSKTDNFKFKIKKSSINEFDQVFMDSITSTLPKKSNFYEETLSDFYGNKDPKNQKISVLKSAKLLDKENQISIESVQDRIQPIVDLRIKPDSYFKFKSGFFPIDIQISGVNLRSLDSSDNKRLDELKNKKFNQKKRFNSNNRNFIKKMFKYYLDFDFEKKKYNLEVFKKSRRYNFELVELSYIGYDPIYIIDYSPKSSKGIFKGRLYIHADDFALVRIDYQSLLPVRDFSLFGVSFKIDYRFGRQIFKKNSNNKYDLYFSENSYKSSFGLNRPLKIVEKNKNVKGRRKQNELKMDIRFSANRIVKTEFIVLNNSSIDKSIYDSYRVIEADLPYRLKEYDPDFWKGYNIIEPSEIIKEFKIDKN